LVPALAVRQPRAAHGNFNQHAPPVDFYSTIRTTDAAHAGRSYQELSVKAANTPRHGTARPPGSIGGRRSGQDRTRAPAEHRHRASASPADAAHTPVRIDAPVRKRQHVASHARHFLASHRTNNTARTTSNQAHLGMRLRCSPGLADTSARSPRLRRGLVSSPGPQCARISTVHRSRPSDSRKAVARY